MRSTKNQEVERTMNRVQLGTLISLRFASNGRRKNCLFPERLAGTTSNNRSVKFWAGKE